MTEQPTTSSTAVANGHTKRTDGADPTFWRDHTQITLSPVAAPSILGLYGFAASTFMVAGNIAGLFGTAATPLILFPLAFAFGGVAQLLAGMWSYRARDAVATGMHGTWGSFWIAYGFYYLLVALGVLPSTATNAVAATAFGMWFVVLAAITYVGALAAAAENMAIASVLLTLAGGSTLLAIGLIGGFPTVLIAGGWVLVASAVLAWYSASAMMLEAAFKREILPMGKITMRPKGAAAEARQAIQYQVGEPGLKAGQ